MTQFIFLVILGYLSGSISSAMIVCKMFGLPNPREEGSKNPGATNVLRIAGKQYAAAVMLADLLKGTIPVIIAKYIGTDPVTIGFTALAAVIGHIYPIFFNFKGGKGVATAMGALLGLHFILGVIVAATWLITANISKYASLASMISMSLMPLLALIIIGNINLFPPLFIITLLIVYKHRNNITRLMDGIEPKIKFKKNIIEEITEAVPTATESPHETASIETVLVKEKKKMTIKKTTVKTEDSSSDMKKRKTTKTSSHTKKEEKPAKKSQQD